MTCSECRWPVIEGPEGGYVCGQCFHVVEPTSYEQRRQEGLQRIAAERRERTIRRRSAA